MSLVLKWTRTLSVETNIELSPFFLTYVVKNDSRICYQVLSLLTSLIMMLEIDVMAFAMVICFHLWSLVFRLRTNALIPKSIRAGA